MTDVSSGHPSIQRIARIARALGDELASEVVFIGAAILPLLHTDPPFDQTRPTKDADAVIATTRYSDLERLHDVLRNRGFRQDLLDPGHMHRWLSQEGDAFDLVPAGHHPGGTGQEWDRVALETSVHVRLNGLVSIRHASAPAFLALKWAAHGDRGAEDSLRSQDLEDILALLASRPSIIEEVRVAPENLQAYVAENATALLADAAFGDLLAAHLNNAQDPPRVSQWVLERLTMLAGHVSS